ncbi:cysteine desulfurase family protein [Halalkalibacillus sediminis]|uniref:cysteine desulfurase family protein n=1 Tax=Halalkalibacillus sediminis TaxID=2018042 RepID=UPI00138FFFBE|nr:IscS subfamily cysteine desulfurase [Halalkalibacillus sediminis]
MKYFDYAATTPMCEEALEAYKECASTYYANANSLHDLGTSAEQLYTQCKRTISEVLGADTDQLFITNGGSEANWIALDFHTNNSSGKHIIISQAEHNSLHKICEIFKKEGYSITSIPLDESGRINIGALQNATTEDTCLVALQHINGEIGTMQPIDEVANWCEEKQIKLHVDAVQSFGKLDISHITKRVDSLSFASHKFYGPKGSGGLYLKEAHNTNAKRTSQLMLEGNTIDVPSVAAMTVAAKVTVGDCHSEFTRMKYMREEFIDKLSSINHLIEIYGCENEDFQLPSILGLGIRGLEGQWLMLECNRKGYAISTGSACDVKYNHTPNTLKALGVSDERAKEFIRISFGKYTKLEDVIGLAQTIKEIVYEHLGIDQVEKVK